MSKIYAKYLAISVMLLVFMSMVSSASTVTGIAFVTLNQTHLFLYLNSTTHINYNVTLYNGTAGNTTMGVTPLKPTTALLPNGVNIGFSKSSGVPPFSGILTVSIAANAIPGNYTAGIETGGADNSRHGFPTLFITVYNSTKPVTSTVPTTTVSPTNTTTVSPTAPTTVPSTVPPITTTVSPTSTISPNLLTYLVAAIVVIVVVSIIIYLAIRRKRW
ncbi:MAG: hypothetical protein M1465_02760 [Candidatus Marsarchaeota archaeon]|jgi:hypothetical protein|nr:hypothetical protein [Candidatus Marsarchaeota archaeon]